jgi:hypothetical protein
MRLSCMVDNQSEREKMKDFTEWILNIGDGKKHQMTEMR